MRACDLNLCIDLHRSRQIPPLPPTRSSPPTPSTIPLNRPASPRPPPPPERVAPPAWGGIRKPSQKKTLVQARPRTFWSLVHPCRGCPSIQETLGGHPIPRYANSEQTQQVRTSTKLNSSLVRYVVDI